MKFSIRVKLLIFAAFIWTVIFGVYAAYIYKERIAQTRRMALTTATFISREVSADRQFYTATAVKRAMDAGLSASGSYHDNDRAIPLPATFIKEVGQSLSSENGFHLGLVSLSPVNPSSLPKDPFEREALERFSKGLDSRYYSFEKYNGIESLRFMIPDIATTQACVDCHNNNPSSPKRDYKIGDVLGGLEIVVPLQTETAAAFSWVWRSIGYGFAVILVMGIAGFAFIRRTVTAPISDLADATKYLATGDLTNEVSVRSDDEIGDLGARTNELVRNFHRMIEDIRSATEKEGEIANKVMSLGRLMIEGSKKQGASLDSVDENITGINASIDELSRQAGLFALSLERGASSVLDLGAGINGVVDNMESLFSSVDETARSTREMSFSIKEISENMESLSSSVTLVSSSMTQINAKIREIETSAVEAARFGDGVINDARSGLDSVESAIEGITRAKEMSGESALIMSRLRERIKEIGNILNVIQDVAEETNLLALNAAIIAAQSGEHGKSFTVVANEIKDLAERASTSANDVSTIIKAVEAESERAVKSMEKGLGSVEEGVRLSIESGEGLKKIAAGAQRSASSILETAKAAGEQAKQSRMAVEAIEKVAEMTRRIVSATQERARGSELINRASERLAGISSRVKSSARSQVEASNRITATIEELNRIMAGVNHIVREQARNSVKVFEAIDTVRKLSFENIEKTKETGKSFDDLAALNKKLMDSVRRFKLRK